MTENYVIHYCSADCHRDLSIDGYLPRLGSYSQAGLWIHHSKVRLTLDTPGPDAVIEKENEMTCS